MSRSLEALEARRLLSSSPLGTRVVEFNGDLAEAYRGHWIVQLDGYEGVNRLEQEHLAGLKAKQRHEAPEVKQQLVADGLFLMRVPTSWETGRTLRFFKSLPGFVAAEPDWRLETQATPNDPSFGSLWGMNNAANTDINAPQAWDISKGSRNVIMGVVDSGVLITHPDLAANIWVNPGEIPGNGIDDDGNGFIDDVNGWDFLSNDNNPTDLNGHGTHVAGTIGAVGNNGIGVAGVNWNVSILPFRTGGTSPNDPSISLSAVLGSMNYMTMMKDRGHNIVGSNHSWGGGGFSSSLNSAISAHNARGMMVIAASGNDGSDNDTVAQYPANYNFPNVISVANSTSGGGLASSSNFGDITVDLAAPGSGILSTYLNNGYASLSGTSMASPHVAGVVALMHAVTPGLQVPIVRNALLSTTTPVTSHAGRTVTGGRLNAFNALLAVQDGTATTPSVPQLAPGSDTGVDGGDRVTNIASPTFSGTVEPGTLVELLIGETVVATTYSSDGTWQATTSPLSDGTYEIVAVGRRGNNFSPASAPVTVTIDQTAPAVSNIEFVWSAAPHTLAITLTESTVASLDPTKVILTNTNTNTVVPASDYTISHNPADRTSPRIIYTGSATGALPNGRYRLDFTTGAASDLAGNTLSAASANFSFLLGDLNRSGRVDFADMLIIAQNFGQTGRPYVQGNINFDTDGRVDFADLLILAQAFNTTLITSNDESRSAILDREDDEETSLLA
jgi:subtilisin family serine protease